MKNLFQFLPNLSKLTIKIKNIYLNGYDWKKLIKNYFPKLKIFQLKMELKFLYSRNIEEESSIKDVRENLAFLAYPGCPVLKFFFPKISKKK